MIIIAILNHMGVYFKEEPIRELHKALEALDFQIVYPNDREDLLKLIDNNARLCGVIFDWDTYNLDLCEEISAMNEHLPVYAFANTHSTLDVSLNDLRLNVEFFEYRANNPSGHRCIHRRNPATVDQSTVQLR